MGQLRDLIEDELHDAFGGGAGHLAGLAGKTPQGATQAGIGQTRRFEYSVPVKISGWYSNPDLPNTFIYGWTEQQFNYLGLREDKPGGRVGAGYTQLPLYEVNNADLRPLLSGGATLQVWATRRGLHPAGGNAFEFGNPYTVTTNGSGILSGGQTSPGVYVQANRAPPVVGPVQVVGLGTVSGSANPYVGTNIVVSLDDDRPLVPRGQFAVDPLGEYFQLYTYEAPQGQDSQIVSQQPPTQSQLVLQQGTDSAITNFRGRFNGGGRLINIQKNDTPNRLVNQTGDGNILVNVPVTGEEVGPRRGVAIVANEQTLLVSLFDDPDAPTGDRAVYFMEANVPGIVQEIINNDYMPLAPGPDYAVLGYDLAGVDPIRFRTDPQVTQLTARQEIGLGVQLANDGVQSFFNGTTNQQHSLAAPAVQYSQLTNLPSQFPPGPGAFLQIAAQGPGGPGQIVQAEWQHLFVALRPVTNQAKTFTPTPLTEDLNFASGLFVTRFDPTFGPLVDLGGGETGQVIYQPPGGVRPTWGTVRSPLGSININKTNEGLEFDTVGFTGTKTVVTSVTCNAGNLVVTTETWTYLNGLLQA